MVETDRVILVGFSVHERPVDGEMDELRVTVPGKALSDWIVMVEVPETPEFALRAVGLADIEKSGMSMLYVTVAERERVLLVPVTVTVYDPARVAVQERVLVPDPPVMVEEVRLHDMPVLGESASARETVPVKPFAGVIVTVEP